MQAEADDTDECHDDADDTRQQGEEAERAPLLHFRCDR
jgi:hypothetical protein